jgi:hypothetical protein
MKHVFLEIAGATPNSKLQTETKFETYRNNQENNNTNEIKHTTWIP